MSSQKSSRHLLICASWSDVIVFFHGRLRENIFVKLNSKNFSEQLKCIIEVGGKTKLNVLN